MHDSGYSVPVSMWNDLESSNFDYSTCFSFKEFILREYNTVKLLSSTAASVVEENNDTAIQTWWIQDGGVKTDFKSVPRKLSDLR